MPTVKLSDLGIQKLKRSEKHIDYFDLTLPTFGVRVSPKGTKTFILKLRSGRQALGRYPILSLSDARTEAKRIVAERTLGRIRPRSVTYQQAVKLFIEDKKRSRRESTADQYEWFLNRLGFGQLADITHDDVERQLGKIDSRSTRDHVLVAARIFFNWCIKRRYVEHNPTTGLSQHAAVHRSRVLTDAEIKKIWDACCKPHEDLPANYRSIVKLLICCGQRRGEIAALQSSWINANEKTCTLPSEVCKNGREHTFPLGNLAVDILSPLLTRESVLFPARGKALPSNGWSKSKTALDKISGAQNWTLHDLRRTYRTVHARIGTPPHIAERLVNHVSSRTAVEKIYDRYEYVDEMRSAVEKYENFLQSIGVG